MFFQGNEGSETKKANKTLRGGCSFLALRQGLDQKTTCLGTVFQADVLALKATHQKSIRAVLEVLA